MKVIRLCKGQEIKQILETHSFSGAGLSSVINPKLNTHLYKRNEFYLHFFTKLENIFYLNVQKGCFICTYDMPNELLEQYQGIGYYLDFIFYRNLVEVVEYAVESKKMNFDYLEKVEVLKVDLDYEDLLDSSLDDFTEVIYQKNSFLTRKKEKS